MSTTIFLLFENCKFVKGYTRSAIYDIGRQDIYYVPNQMTDLIGKIQLGLDQNAPLNEEEHDYLQFLLNKEIVVPIPKKLFKQFKPIDQKFQSPYDIHSITLFSEHLERGIDTITSSNLNIPYVYLKDVETDPNLLLQRLIDNSTNSLLENARLIFINEKYNTISEGLERVYKDKIVLAKKVNKLNKRNVNISFYLEATNQNVFYSGLLEIRLDGFIYFSQEKVSQLGNSSSAFSNVLVKMMNSELIHAVTKDRIEVCKECEHRLMCFDPEGVVYNANSERWFRRSECDYNPFICKFSSEDNYQSVSDCGVSITDKGLVIDEIYLNLLLARLWE